jgi:outer membrane protein TolC
MPAISRSAPTRTNLAAGAAALLLASGCFLAPSRFIAGRSPASPERPVELPPPPPAAPPERAPMPAQPRSLGDLLDLALSRDPSTRAAWHEARAAAAQAGSRRGAYLPALDLSGTAERSQIPASASRTETRQTTFGVGASLSWLLLDLGQRSASVREGDQLALAASLGHRAAVADLVLRVEEAYYLYLAARALVVAQRTNVEQTEANLAAAENRRRSGVATIADVLQARTAASQARLTLQSFEGATLALRGQLATQVGLEPTVEIDVGELPARVEVQSAAPRVEALLVDASEQNPDLARARAVADAAGARADAAARAWLPRLGARASVGQFWYEAPHADPGLGWSGGLVLEWPIFQGFSALYDARAARESAEAARARVDATTQGVMLDVWTTYQSLRTAVLRVETSRDLVESAGASADVAAARYKEGVGSILDVLNAQTALALARAEEVRARADWFLSLARLARATGRAELGRPDAPIPDEQGDAGPAPKDAPAAPAQGDR